MVELLDSRQAVGVFDSGVGGLSVLRALLATLPTETFVFVADELHLPYGDKPQYAITERVLGLSHWLRSEGCKAMVMACNTATAAGADQARAIHANWPIVGIEPAVKPASLMTKTGVVGILATKNTVASERFKALVQRFDPMAKVLAVPCPGLVELIERSPIPRAEVCGLIEPVLQEFKSRQVDVIVLGCTHYPFVIDLIQELAGPGVQIIETGLPVAKQLKTRLEAEHLSNPQTEVKHDVDRVCFYTTGNPADFKTKLCNLMGSQWRAVEVQQLKV